MSSLLGAAIVVEAKKLAASRIVASATVLLVIGVSILVSSMAAAAEAGNEQILAQLGPIGNEQGWERFWGVAVQVSAAASLLCFGVVLAWAVGREFADGTISGLFAIPIPRSAIALAKVVTTTVWAAATALALVVALLFAGTLIVGPPDATTADGLVRLLVVTLLSGLIATPTAFAATAGRGLLPGIAVAILMIATAQVLAVAGTGAWFPIAAPALWALHPGTVEPVQLALVTVVPLVSVLLTARAWSRLELDR